MDASGGGAQGGLELQEEEEHKDSMNTVRLQADPDAVKDVEAGIATSGQTGPSIGEPPPGVSVRGSPESGSATVMFPDSTRDEWMGAVLILAVLILLLACWEVLEARWHVCDSVDAYIQRKTTQEKQGPAVRTEHYNQLPGPEDSWSRSWLLPCMLGGAESDNDSWSVIAARLLEGIVLSPLYLVICFLLAVLLVSPRRTLRIQGRSLVLLPRSSCRRAVRVDLGTVRAVSEPTSSRWWCCRGHAVVLEGSRRRVRIPVRSRPVQEYLARFLRESLRMRSEADPGLAQ